MRGGTLPATLIFAALGLALAFAPPRTRAPALVLAAGAAFAGLAAATDPSFAELVYLYCWICIVAASASVHWRGGVPGWMAAVLAAACGAGAGMVLALTGRTVNLPLALAGALVIVPASWLVAAGKGIAVKVGSSWLIAIALLAAALPLTPTPGYEPDHME